MEWSEWIPNDGTTYGPDFEAREVVEVRLADGTTVLAAASNHSGGSCGCCSTFSWCWWYAKDGEPRAGDVVAYRKLVIE